MDISRIFLNNNKEPNFKPAISFNYSTFTKIFMGDLEDLDKNFEWLGNTIGSAFNLNRGFVSIRLSNIYGYEFTFSFYGRDLCLWDHSGGTAIGNVLLDDNLKIRKEQLSRIIRLTEKFTNGIIECSLCNKEIDYQENRIHRYYAGIYCSECWNSEMKVKAENENYD